MYAPVRSNRLKKSVADLEKKMKDMPAGGGGTAVLKEGPKEYAVETVPHTAIGEVDNAGIAKVLEARAKDGWKLVSVINDEGGKLQASLGGTDTSSLNSLSSGGFTSKEDRVVMIFERPKKLLK